MSGSSTHVLLDDADQPGIHNPEWSTHDDTVNPVHIFVFATSANLKSGSYDTYWTHKTFQLKHKYFWSDKHVFDIRPAEWKPNIYMYAIWCVLLQAISIDISFILVMLVT